MSEFDKTQLEIVRQSSLEAVIEMSKGFGKELSIEQVEQATNYVVGKCYSKGKEKQELIIMQNCVKNAVRAIPIKLYELTTMTKVMDLADKFYEIVIK